MGLAFCIFALIINTLVLFKNTELGVSLFVLLSLISPFSHVGDVTISYDIFGFPTTFLICLLKEKQTKLASNEFLLILYTVILTISTAIAVFLLGGMLEPFSLVGIYRIVLTLYIISRFMKAESMHRVIYFVAILNATLAIIQYAIPESVIIFYNLYYRESSTPLSVYLEMGYNPRATGTFSSPVNLGVFSLITFAISTSGLLKGQKRLLSICGILASMICGSLAASKLYVIGAPLLLATSVVASTITRGQDNQSRIITLMTALGFLGLIGVFGIYAAGYLSEQNSIFSHALDALSSPTNSLTSRYDTTSGNLAGTFDVIKEYPVLGVGSTLVAGEFRGDSAYVSIAHDTGFVGCVIMFLFLASLFRRAISVKDTSSIILLVALLLAGMALPVFFSIPGVLVMSHVIRTYMDRQQEANISGTSIFNQGA